MLRAGVTSLTPRPRPPAVRCGFEAALAGPSLSALRTLIKHQRRSHPSDIQLRQDSCREHQLTVPTPPSFPLSSRSSIGSFSSVPQTLPRTPPARPTGSPASLPTRTRPLDSSPTSRHFSSISSRWPSERQVLLIRFPGRPGGSRSNQGGGQTRAEESRHKIGARRSRRVVVVDVYSALEDVAWTRGDGQCWLRV